MAFRLKKVLLPALQHSEVHSAADVDTDPRWCWLAFSSIGSPHTCHDLVWVRDFFDWPMTRIDYFLFVVRGCSKWMVCVYYNCEASVEREQSQ